MEWRMVDGLISVFFTIRSYCVLDHLGGDGG